MHLLEDEDVLQAPPDDDQIKGIMKAVICGVALELVLCVIAQFSFTDTFLMWITLGVSMAIRIVCMTAFCYDSEGAMNEILKATFFFMSIWPFLFYVVFLDWDYVHQCSQSFDKTEIGGLTSTANQTKILIEPKIVCNEPDWLPFETEMVEYIPLAIQFGVPFLFASLFLSSANLFGADIRRSKTLFQLAILDYFDIANFATLAFTLKGWIWFDANPKWFLAFLGMVVVAWVASVTEVSAGLLQSMSSKVAKYMCMPTYLRKVSSEKGFSLLSMLFINLPLGLSRGYFVKCGVDVEYVFLAKNIVCAIYEIAAVCGCTCVTKYLASLIAMVPGADAVDSASEDLEKKIMSRRLERQQSDLFEQRREKQQLKKQADGDKAKVESLRNSVQHKLENAMYLVTMIDHVMVSSDMEEYEAIKAKVADAFRSFDDDKNGTLSAMEINERAFSFVGRQDDAIDFIAFAQQKMEKNRKQALKASDEIDIDEVADYFMMWRCEEDGDEHDEDKEDHEEDDTEEDE